MVRRYSNFTQTFDQTLISIPECNRSLGMLVTCSQMLWIKNKATQLLNIKDLCPSKHYLLSDIMIFERRS
jgi:hypothetical protein